MSSLVAVLLSDRGETSTGVACRQWTTACDNTCGVILEYCTVQPK